MKGMLWALPRAHLRLGWEHLILSARERPDFLLATAGAHPKTIPWNA